jgi:hypothetical protein
VIPTKAKSKDLLEVDRLNVVKNPHAYHVETKVERQKLKEKTFKVGDLVLLQSPHTKNSGKLLPKWDIPYVITEKTGHGSFRLAYT